MQTLQQGTEIRTSREEADVARHISSLRRSGTEYVDAVLRDLENRVFEKEEDLLAMEEAA